MTYHQQITTVITLLEHVQKRPFMYIVPADPFAFQNFMSGFMAACAALDLHVAREAHTGEVLAAHGWSMSPATALDQMREQGLSVEDMVRELLRVEVEVWKRLRAERVTNPPT